MNITNKEYFKLLRLGSCEVIRLQKISKKAIKDNDLCDDYLRCENPNYNNYLNKKQFTVRGLTVIVTNIEIIKVNADNIHVPKNFYKELLAAFPNLIESEILANPTCYKLTLKSVSIA